MPPRVDRHEHPPPFCSRARDTAGGVRARWTRWIVQGLRLSIVEHSEAVGGADFGVPLRVSAPGRGPLWRLRDHERTVTCTRSLTAYGQLRWEDIGCASRPPSPRVLSTPPAATRSALRRRTGDTLGSSRHRVAPDWTWRLPMACSISVRDIEYRLRRRLRQQAWRQVAASAKPPRDRERHGVFGHLRAPAETLDGAMDTIAVPRPDPRSLRPGPRPHRRPEHMTTEHLRRLELPSAKPRRYLLPAPTHAPSAGRSFPIRRGRRSSG